MSMLWLAIYFPQLQLDSLCFLGEETQVACVIVDSKQRVLQCNSLALEGGIVLDMGLGTASALVEPLRFYDIDQAFQLSRLQELALCCYQHSADIVVRDTCSCLLFEVSSMLSLYASLEGYLSALFARLQTQDVSYTFALAGTPLAAELLARNRPSTQCSGFEPADAMAKVLALRLACLDIPKVIAERLTRLGLQSVNDVCALPRKELAMKFGTELLLYLDQVLGELATPLSLFRPQESFKRSLVFEQEACNTGALLFPLKYALEGFESFLRERSAKVQELHIDLIDRQNDCLRVSLVSAEPEASSRVWLSLLRLKLDTIQLKKPVLALVLESEQLLDIQAEHQDLFTGSRATQSPAQVLSRIQARLGEGSVSRLSLQDDHRPEYSFATCSLAGSSLGAARKKSSEQVSSVAETAKHYHTEARALSSPAGLYEALQSSLQSLRPSLLFDAPQVLSEAVRIIHGPERIQSAWWSEHEVCRDYFVALNMSKQRLWVFRDHTQQWFVHGLFA